MILAFESIIAIEEAKKHLRNSTQRGKVPGYITKFQELQSKLPGMMQEEAFSTLLASLNPDKIASRSTGAQRSAGDDGNCGVMGDQNWFRHANRSI